MAILILGTPEVWLGAELRRPSRRMATVLLSLLALRANQSLSMDWITDALWDGSPPRSAAANVRSHLTDLRRLLTSQRESSPRIDVAARNCTLVCQPDAVDALLFRRLLSEGRRHRANCEYRAAAGCLTRATAAWRGDLMQGLTVPAAVRGDVAELEDLRVTALEELIETRLTLGEHGELAALLRRVVAEFPLRERLWRQLMVALYRAGRPGEALAAYRRLYQVLDEELGAQPSPAVRRVHEQILRQDPTLRFVTGAVEGRRGPATVARQAPPHRTLSARQSEALMLWARW